ncbi:hypothetical protein Pint_21645 [Pistacia integerrima]|uniref:Uncharacterized protein n=1 Tax=Pistacia integerrima TaxID=434235 RepID=A0ACC0XFK6_9ROSI|nr:hypothetical protein Pint_21645 [Pistacia integerrima]
MSEIKRRGSQTVTDLILASKKEGHPFTCLVYTRLLRWAAVVAHRRNLPSALLWIQPAMVFDAYYCYFYGYGDMIKLPWLPSLRSCDLPSFSLPSDKYPHALESFQEQMEVLHEESNPKILINTFDALESEALIAIDKFNMIAVGPLIPSAFLDGKDPYLFRGSNDYIEWLNSKPKSSVVYVSFGSLIVLEKQQMEEIARGLLASAHPFLWVIRENQNEEEDKEEDKLMNCRSREELEQQGMIVPWCSQVEVLSNPAIGCFVMHCGWNSTLESLACGVPVVAFPQWTDQATNAKLIENIWKTGVRVSKNEEGIAKSGEIKRCLELVMGEGAKREELTENAKKWRDLAREAANEGGSSDTNLKAFVNLEA